MCEASVGWCDVLVMVPFHVFESFHSWIDIDKNLSIVTQLASAAQHISSDFFKCSTTCNGPQCPCQPHIPIEKCTQVKLLAHFSTGQSIESHVIPLTLLAILNNEDIILYPFVSTRPTNWWFYTNGSTQRRIGASIKGSKSSSSDQTLFFFILLNVACTLKLHTARVAKLDMKVQDAVSQITLASLSS